jgi:hypothetical protein
VSCDRFSLLDEDSDDAAGHGGFEGDGAVAPGGTATLAQGAGIFNAIRDALGADLKRRVGRVTVEDDSI